jgi:HSP20 family protein
MKRKKNFSNFSEASEFLGEDFWEVMTDILPFIGPRIDVIRTPKEIVIFVEIPGVLSQEDLSLNLQGPMLLIEGMIYRQYIEDDVQVLQDERFNGKFKRKIKIPEDCIAEQMRANYVKGLLEIRIPTFINEATYPKNRVPIQFVDENQHP